MTSILKKSNKALSDLENILVQLPLPGSYTEPCRELSNATIGEHTRHIIELFQCLLSGYASGSVNYDDRKRNKLYENSIDEAVAVIKEIQNKLDQPDKQLNIVCGTGEQSISIGSNYYREVLYNLEHCIHHQALIKVALISMNVNLISEEFGVAPSTLQYRRQCAQ